MHVLGQEGAAAGFRCGGEDDRVPDNQAVSAASPIAGVRTTSVVGITMQASCQIRKAFRASVGVRRAFRTKTWNSSPRACAGNSADDIVIASMMLCFALAYSEFAQTFRIDQDVGIERS